MKTVAVETHIRNLDGECHETFLTPGLPEKRRGVEILVGGPPCQPFSQFGYQRGKKDSRDGFPVFLDAMKRFRPKIAIIENVRGLLYRNKEYLRAAIKDMERLGYVVHAELLKAVEYGVPQKRERVFVVASTIGWEWPERVFDEPVTAGVALGPLAQDEDKNSRYLKPNEEKYISRYEVKSNCITPRDLHLDKPARTVTCRNLGGKTSDMHRIKTPSGKRRMLTVREGARLQSFHDFPTRKEQASKVREGARLQSFPDWFEFSGTEYEKFEQIGNAVPPLLGLAVARQVIKALEAPSSRHRRNGMSEGIISSNPINEEIEQAINIFKQIGIPVRRMTPRRRERVAKALLAVAGILPDMQWSEATSHFDGTAKPLTTREIIKIWNEHYGEKIADSSYDDVSRKDLAILVESGLVARSAADPTADVNDSTRGYSIPLETLKLLHSYGTVEWDDHIQLFRSNVGELKDRLSKAREFKMVPVTLPNGKKYRLSPGPHNIIQKAVVEDFLPRFSKGAEILYIGDTAKKILHMDADRMKNIGISEMERNLLPDILAYETKRNWLFVIEAVHSINPISDMRHLELHRLTEGSVAGCLFISAFANRASFGRFSQQISWGTEVWVADEPDHCNSL